MGDNVSAFEEGGWSDPFRSIDDLVRDDEVSWSNLFRKRPNRTECYYGFYADRGERGDIRSCRHCRWTYGVRDTVARKERNSCPI